MDTGVKKFQASVSFKGSENAQEIKQWLEKFKPSYVISIVVTISEGVVTAVIEAIGNLTTILGRLCDHMPWNFKPTMRQL